MLDHPETGMPFKVTQVCGCTRYQIVNRKDFPPAVDQNVTKMRPQESRAARDYRAQRERLSAYEFAGEPSFFMIAFASCDSCRDSTFDFSL
jgi:hypothetical protein